MPRPARTHDQVVEIAAGVAPKRRVPDVGAILPIPTPAGRRFYRVFRAHAERVTLVPLSVLEIAELMEALQRQQRPPGWIRRAGQRLRARLPWGPPPSP